MKQEHGLCEANMGQRGDPGIHGTGMTRAVSPE